MVFTHQKQQRIAGRLNSLQRLSAEGFETVIIFAVSCAGHVEVAVILIAGLNLAALVHALLGCCRKVEEVMVLARMGIGTGLFLWLTAPVWLSFLAALEGTYSMHEQIQVVQQPRRLH